MKQRIIRLSITVLAILAFLTIGKTQKNIRYENLKVEDIKSGINVTNSHIDKFAGVWLWKDKESSLKLVLRKENISYPSIQMTGDAIIGFHRFIKNGLVEESTTDYANTKYKDKKSSIIGNTVVIQNQVKENHLKGSIIHLSKDKSVKFDIEYIDSNHIKLVKVTNTPGVKISTPGKPYDSSISLPQNIILMRKK